MLHPRLTSRHVRRGAAMVEFLLVAPLLVSILLFSLFLTDIIRAKFKLQEASRYVAWEMTSYTLSDYGGSDPARAFQTAQAATVREATERYKDLDSLEPNSRFGTLLRAEAPQVVVKDEVVAGLDLSVIAGGGTAAASKSLDAVLGHFKFNTQGQVQVRLTSALSASLLPRHYLQKDPHGFFTVDHWGGRDLSHLPIQNQYTLIATGWQLPDGSDAVVTDRQAGLHSGGKTRHGLALQVDRMKFLGIEDPLEDSGLHRITDALAFPLPAFMGTFVVSHNYTKDTSRWHGCNKTRHSGPSGLHNLEPHPGLDEHSKVDLEQRCFDTAPFRDTQAYDKSLYKRMFDARGEHFMGCKKAQADRPDTPGVPEGSHHDRNERKITCE
jgi:Flp pilus assembly protein TadG